MGLNDMCMTGENVNPLDVLIVEDDEPTASALARVLEREGFTCEAVLTLADALNRAGAAAPSIVLLDLALPDGDGVEVIESLKTNGVNEVIVISGTDDAERTRRCLQAGVFDFILKPATAEELLRSVRRADAHRRQAVVEAQEYPAPLKPGFGSLEGVSPASQRLLETIRHVAADPAGHALVIGQPGVLKADVAALLHHHSGRSGRALLVNCASEKDGQDKQRFFGQCSVGGTGDNPESTGYLHKADEGTLVLDDVSALSIALQRRLMSYMGNNEILSEGALKPVRVHCALIAVLREPADRALSEGRLHEPFFYALARNTVSVPPLVERREDIRFFAQNAVAQLNKLFATEKSLSQDLIAQLEAYYWPGNLVELKNTLLTAYRYTEAGDEMKSNTHLFAEAEELANDAISPFVGQRFKEVEKQLIIATLEAHGNNKSQTAKVLGISLKTLYNRLNSYEKDANETAQADTVLS